MQLGLGLGLNLLVPGQAFPTADLLAAYDFSKTIEESGVTYYKDLSGNDLNAVKTTNLITNGNCELDYGFNFWSVAPPINERSSEQANSGTYSRKVGWTVSGVQGVRTLGFTTKVGETVYWEIFIYGLDGVGTVKYAIRNGNDDGYTELGSLVTVNGEWTKNSGSYIETDSGDDAYIIIYSTSGYRTFYVDDISAEISGVDLITLPLNSEISDNLENVDRYYISGNPINVRMSEIVGEENNQIFFKEAYKMLIYSTQLYGNDLVKAIDYIGYDYFETIENIVSVGVGKDYATIPLALLGITDASSSKVYRIDIYDDFIITDKSDYTFDDGVYYRYIVMKPYIFLNGIGIQKKIICSIPETATDEESTYYETSIFNENMCGAKNVYFSMKNGRYAAHMDGIQSYATMFFDNCYFEHFGNQEIIDYRIANSQDYSHVHDGVFGIGMGTSTGNSLYFNACTIKSIKVMFIHNSSNFTVPHYLRFNNSNFISSGVFDTNQNPLSELKSSLYITCLNSDQININEHNKCTFNSYITYESKVNDSGDPSGISYLLADMSLIGKDNIENGINNISTIGGSLFIQSSTNGNVTVTGGDAESVIIPDFETFNYGALGKMEVGEWAKNTAMSLGSRLGDCSSTNKTLSVLVDGSQAIDIIFNEDFTSATNEYVLSFINTELSTYATASLYQRAKDYLPTWN